MIDLSSEIQHMLREVKEGWCWPEKAIAMANLILETQPKLVVEIGIFGGRSLLPQALALQKLNHGRIVGIDPMKVDAAIEGNMDSVNDKWWSSLQLHKIHDDFMDHLWRLKLHWRCVVIRSSSEECADLFGEQSIDILHLDGNHSEEVSCRDLKTWEPKVKMGGYIWFDDSNWTSTQAALKMMPANCVAIKDVALKDVGECRLFQKR